jgi:hypothetical protein
MILHPAVIALLATSLLVSLLVLYAASFAVSIVRGWDITSGSEEQLALERRTYLVSTIMAFVCAFEVLSLFFYLLTADGLHGFFTGAMCAAGTLNVNDYGYPTLLLKIVNFLAAGTWLIVNNVDNRAEDYPLTRKKYVFLLALAPFVVAETVGLANYLLRLDPDIITSCCGSLFSTGSATVQSGLASLPQGATRTAFYTAMALCAAAGTRFYLSGRGAYLFSGIALANLAIAIASVVSFISLYFYDLPTHHCPFCILQREYWYVGYPLYMALLGGGVSAIGVGALAPFGKTGSLATIIPGVQKRLALTSMVLYLLFTAIVSARMVTSPLVLG